MIINEGRFDLLVHIPCYPLKTEDVVQSRSLPKVVRASYVAKMEMERFSAQKASGSCKSSDLQRTEKKKFLFTTIEEKERLEMMEIISRLGGECSSMNEYDPSCTHLICGKIMRNEKLVSAISNGLWVLEKDYVYDSGEANVWKKESEYECGEPSRMKKRSFPNEISRKLALASRRWRLKLSENVGASGAFSNWRVLMFMSTKRFASLRRLIEFGGGSAYLPSTLKDYDGITHALVGHSPLWNKKEANSLASLGIRCFNMDYIATFLTEDPLHEEDHYHPDYRACLNNLLSGT
ncbi:hypothetical protein AB6A40_009780 [Gnathostoma spinigerum]|uniref:BRCT domain-containing protein n=1 Tax=Gnathostoma spinigerum TaxID=75299 RepID=A0ABD6EUQ8_9BILA